MKAPRHGHPAVLAANDLHGIADLWPELEARVGRTERAGGERVKGTPATPLPVDPHVIDVMAEIRNWVHFLARVLIDETDWAPSGNDTPALLRSIADQRIGHFTEHEDEGLALSFCDDAERMRDLAERTARPSGRRWLRIGAACFEHGTSDLGERIPCAGQYRVLADPEKPHVIPDIVCDQDRSHRITPVEWQRAYRRTGDASEAAGLVGRWRGAEERSA